MNISLRSYQQEAIEKVIKSFENGTTRQLLNLPTGAGKTIIMAALAKHLGKRTLLIAHREELITQAMDKFKLVWPDAEFGVCMADQNECRRPIVFGSVQSCWREYRLNQLKENDFEVLLIDEAHHASSPSYQKIIKDLGFYEPGNRKLLVGVTATPMRSDDKELGDTFEEITYSLSIGYMIQSGYLSPVIGRRILTRTSIAGVHSRAGDFAPSELSEAVNTPERNKIIAENYLKYAHNRKGIVFCSDVQHCKDMAEAFKSIQIPTQAVYGDMEPYERKKALHQLKTGEIQVATSCGVLTEGFDEPTISCIAMARPTKFKGLYIQAVGRGLRLHPGKADCLVLDFTDEGHDISTVATLGKAIPEAMHIIETEENEDKDTKTQTVRIKRVCDEEFNILGATRFLWIPIGDDEWSLADDDGREIVMSPCRDGYLATAYSREGEEIPLVQSPLSIEYCSGTCEDYARAHFKLNYASTDSPWLTSDQAPTDGQIAFLQKKGIGNRGMTKAQASMKIREVIAKQRKHFRLMKDEPITEKQTYFLMNYGIETAGMNKLEAVKAIAKIKKESNVVNA